MANFVSYENATQLMGEIGEKFEKLNGAYVIRGNSAFANLPSVLTGAMVGYVYNVTNDFTTDSRFIEGTGKKYSAGTNVVVVDVGTTTYSEVTPEGNENPKEEGWYVLSGGEYALTDDEEVQGGTTYYEKVITHDYKFDVNASFIDVDGINAEIEKVSDMISTADFDNTVSYAIGDIVKYNNVLYKFKAAHSSGDWDSTEVDTVTVLDIIENAEPDSLTTAQVNALLALLD
ncbi:MAG: hypothetical protein IJ736_14285 [Firmicutes bacterium]|nr:hypothetical protein [Bacillota bacterium]